MLSAAHRRLLKRSTKVGLAALLATWFSQLLHLPNPWFATVAAIVAMHSTIQSSARNAGRAALGSAFGAVLGLLVASVAKDQAWAVGLVVAAPLIGFGWMRRREVGEQAALVASVVVLVPSLPELTTAQFAGVRLAQAMIGIAVALAVQSTVFPTRAHRKVRRELAGVYRDMARLIGLAADALGPETSPGGPEPDGDGSAAPGRHGGDAVRRARIDARARLAKVDEMWDDAMSEHPSHALLASHWRVSTRRLWEQCTVLVTEAEDLGDSPGLDPYRDALIRLTTLLHESFADISDWFRTREPHEPIGLPDLDPARRTLLEQVAATGAISGTRVDPGHLRVLAVVNSCNLIAERVGDAATEQLDVVRIAGPGS